MALIFLFSRFISIPDDLVSELSSKSGSPSPAILHRELRESSVASKSSQETNDTNSEFDYGGGMREERFPSPFNKQGSLSSLGVSTKSQNNDSTQTCLRSATTLKKNIYM